MKVKVLKTCAGLSFSVQAGQDADLPDGIAKDLIMAGYAKPADKAPETATKKAPEQATSQAQGAKTKAKAATK